MTDNINIYEISEIEFEEKVLKASSSSLILVDFWAPWCGPCKQLTPLLEKIITSAKGKVKLVKINIDENQQIASQLRIQSIPAVFAFKDGQPVDAFQGVIPEKKIIEFIEKCMGEKIAEDFTEFYEKVSSLIENNKIVDAKDILEKFLVDNPMEFKSFALYIDCLSHLKQYKEAEEFTNSLNTETLSNSFIKSSLQKLSIKKKNSDGPSLEDLINDLKKRPNNLDCVLKLADKYFAENMLDDAFEILLKNYNKNKEQIKNKFLEFFEALGNSNLKTIEYRRKLSSVIFS